MKRPRARIFDPAVSSILKVMQASSGHRYYAAELERQTGLSKPAVAEACDQLCEAGITSKSSETAAQAEQSGLPARVFYELTSDGLAFIRLTHRSS